MLIGLKLKHGEGVLEAFNPEIGRAHRRKKMADEKYREENEKTFCKAFYQMADRLEKLFADYQERLEKKKTKKEKAENNALGKGGDPFELPSPSSSSSFESSSIASSNPKKQPENTKSDLPYLKLDIKFDFPTYNGELNAEKIDDWIKQIEVYYKIQNLADDSAKIQLDTLHLGGFALIWWESKTQ